MYLPSRMQGRGRALRTLLRLRVCSNTQDLETFSLAANSAGVRMSSARSGADWMGPSFSTVAISAPLPDGRELPVRLCHGVRFRWWRIQKSYAFWIKVEINDACATPS